MPQKPMYPGINNSVPTTTARVLAGADTTIYLKDASALPPGPNLATISVEDSAEVVYYHAIEDNSLVGCIRGFDGTLPQLWPEGTVVYRAYTNKDHQTFIDNIDALCADKLDSGGDASAATVAFTESTDQNPPASGGTLSAVIGSLVAWVKGLVSKLVPASRTVNNKPLTENITLAAADIPSAVSTQTYTAANVLAKLLTVDGAGSGLDADMLDGLHMNSFCRVVTRESATSTHTITLSGDGTMALVFISGQSAADSAVWVICSRNNAALIIQVVKGANVTISASGTVITMTTMYSSRLGALVVAGTAA